MLRMRIRGRRRVSPEISQVSMSDIAFLLLIFFLSTTIFDFELGIPMVLPGLQASRRTVERRDVLTLRMDEAGGLFADELPILLDQVEGLVESRLAENPETIIFLATHPRVAYQSMIGLLDEVRVARATRISLQLSSR